MAAARLTPTTSAIITADMPAQHNADALRALALLAPELRALSFSGGAHNSGCVVQPLLHTFAALTQLTCLHISDSPAGNGFSGPLAASLAQLPQLRDLRLRDVCLDACDCTVLAPVLARASALTSLDVSRNPMGVSGWCALAHAGLPASLAAVDACDTFHERGSTVPRHRVHLPPPGGRSTPLLPVLAQALRRCSQLRRLSVGPAQQRLALDPVPALGEWHALRGTLASVRELQGAGEWGFLSSLAALTSLTWQPTVRRPEEAGEQTVSQVGRLVQLQALHVQYKQELREGVPAAPDAQQEQLFWAVAQLRGLTALTLAVDLQDMYYTQMNGLRSILGSVCYCKALRVLNLQLCGSCPRYPGSGAELSALAALSSLQRFALQVAGELCKDPSFQLNPQQGLSFVPGTLLDLTVKAWYTDTPASAAEELACTQLTALRIATDYGWGPVEALPGPADALASSVAQLRNLRELQLVEELHEPYVLAALSALPLLTALEVLRLWSNMLGFPQLVVSAIAGCAGMRQLVVMHDESGYGSEDEPTRKFLTGLRQFSRLEYAGLYDYRGHGMVLKLSVAELAQVFIQAPCLLRIAVKYDPADWELAQRLAGRMVQLVATRAWAGEDEQGIAIEDWMM